MSSDSKNSESPTIERVFGLLDRWRHLPTYQLERRADIFFALFLPEVLEKSCKTQTKIKHCLIPEFPIWNENSRCYRYSKKVDYFALSEGCNRSFFIELKTDMSSIGAEQKEFLHRAARKGLYQLLKDIIWLSESSSKKGKYCHLFRSLKELGLLCNSGQSPLEVQPTKQVCRNKLCPDVIYIQPINESNDSSVITFDDFANIIHGSGQAIENYEMNGIRHTFANYLRKWSHPDV